MTTERSDKLHESHRASGEKFDYFVLGATGAVVAYISQTFRPDKLAFAPNSLELVALLLLFAAAVAGFRRVEKVVEQLGGNYLYLRALEARGSLASTFTGAPLINHETGEVPSGDAVGTKIAALNGTIPRLGSQLDKVTAAALFWYKCRNSLLALGFLALVGSKVWAAYVST
jgi:hypothetical protein